ncbi:hypothetical protein HP570_20365 [Brevibacillus sp. RS1.1]|uniref:hypothetical protein n=1 Tax=Brevibacillus sp. RS1.1 TaxID=2738982 RepID=UPI00156ADE66|nr:hypothetical protein [Brevibacillus sp. RS1.1]NRR04572.1 hypothetical protein [Brevibacillus sp. RS1.1]
MKITDQLAIENAVLKHAVKLHPFNNRQVVLALSTDYACMLDFDDETGQLDASSVTRALKSLAVEEPNLFYTPEAAKDLDEDNLKGTAPGGSLPSYSTLKSKEQRMVTDALERMGIKRQTEKGGE